MIMTAITYPRRTVCSLKVTRLTSVNVTDLYCCLLVSRIRDLLEGSERWGHQSRCFGVCVLWLSFAESTQQVESKVKVNRQLP